MQNPLEVFKSLTLKPQGQIKALWPLEREVLQKYFNDLKDTDRVAIELATGSGKSIIGLLLLESWRQDGKRVAILTSSIALAEDMSKRCADLGIESAVITGKREGEAEEITRIQNKRRYARRQAIGIMNYWAYMMAKDIAEPDVLVVDDADFFENFLISFYSVTISRKEDEPIWNQVMNDLSRHRIYQARIEAFRLSDTTEEALVVYFTHSIEIVRKLRTLILSGGDISDELSYSFERNKNYVETYLMFVTRESIVLSPYISPGLLHERLRGIEKIVFMSATIGSREYIHRILGSDTELNVLTEKEVRSQIGTMGKRIIFPLDGITPSPHVEDDILRAITTINERFGKTLIMCNSYRDAFKISKTLDDRGRSATIYNRESDSTGFSRATSGALITAGRFIGLDLPDEACRVAIITRLPFVLGPTDAFAKNVLNDTAYIDEKVGHRLVQAFGRCNRNPSDYAVYFMLDSRLANDNQADAEICGYFPTRMRAELDYGQDYAETGGIVRCMEIANLLLENKLPDFETKVSGYQKSLRGIALPDTGRPYLPEIQAWHELTVKQNYLDAAQRFVECAQLYEKSKFDEEIAKPQVAWANYLAAMSYYLAFLNYRSEDYKAKVINHLKVAVKVGEASWFSGLQLLENELGEVGSKQEEVVFNTEIQEFKERLLRSWKEFADTNTSRKRNPKTVWEEIRKSLVSGTHNEVCDRLKIVFELMGFEVRKRNQEEGEPDLELFATMGAPYVCIVEVKTKEQVASEETEKQVVGRADVDQIAGHKPSYQTQYPGRPVYALLYTNKEDFSKTATTKAANNVRLLRASEFVSFLGRFADLMEKGWNATNPYEKLQVMQKSLMPSDYEEFMKSAENPLVSIEELNSLVKW